MLPDPDQELSDAELPVTIDSGRLADLCARWQVVELSLFGSVLRGDFRPDSDVDILVTFREGAPWSLFDFVRLERELETLVGRRVDLVERGALRNPFRRAEILRTRRPIYAA